ncbi:MAG: protein kinase, partial [Verrucomicrobiota bacterium]
MTKRNPDEQELFLEAIAIESDEERHAWLVRECGDDEAMIRRVKKLLKGHGGMDALLDLGGMPSFSRGPDALSEPTGEEIPPVIGPYTLEDKLGEGGMGDVYRARQTEPIQRDVALKIIKPGMDSRKVVARFEVERQALAMMDHPNIARVID